MKLSLNTLFLGWWLARQCWISRGQTPPKPLISISLAGMVALRENITIFCRSEAEFHGRFYLTRYENASDGGVTVDSRQKAKSSEAAFSLANLSPKYGGMYSCRSCLSESNGCSLFSDKIYLNLTDPSLTKPSIQIRNEEQDAPEANVSIRCKGPKPDLAFALLRSREQIAYKAAKQNKNSADFFHVRLEEAQSYSCQYHHKSHPFVWSESSEPLELPWEDSKRLNPTIKTIPGGSSASGQSPAKPLISISPAGMVAVGGKVTISCRSGDDFDRDFHLIRHESSSDSEIAADTQEGKSSEAAFSLANLSQSDGGIYSCRSRPCEGNGCSPLSDKIYLNLTGVLSPYVWGGIAASLFLLLILLLLAFVWCQKRRKSSTTNEDNSAVSVSLKSDAGEHLDEVSYATLNHQPQKIQPATNPSETSGPCLYATVAKNATPRKQ